MHRENLRVFQGAVHRAGRTVGEVRQPERGDQAGQAPERDQLSGREEPADALAAPLGARRRVVALLLLVDQLCAGADRGERDGPISSVLGLRVVAGPAADGVRRARVARGPADALARFGDGLATEGLVLVRLPVVGDLLRLGGRVQRGADGRVDLLEPEQDDRDVVAPAVGVGGGDQPAADVLQ